ncbi:MAG: NAD(P)/FAD-dependent oxidoreductase, partial [Verrucomicrobiia bacterium]
RVTVPDHRPVAGWTDDSHSIGVFAGLAAKGALWAPALARQWVADGLAGTELEPEVTVTRFD